MKYGRLILVPAFAILLAVGTFVGSASAQRHRGVTVGTVSRPVIVRTYRPAWRYGLWRRPFWGYSGFYDPYWSDPYLSYERQKYYLQSELNGNRRELQKHEEKYRRDGVITAKEARELADDRKDVQKSIQKLNKFNRNY